MSEQQEVTFRLSVTVMRDSEQSAQQIEDDLRASLGRIEGVQSVRVKDWKRA